MATLLFTLDCRGKQMLHVEIFSRFPGKEKQQRLRTEARGLDPAPGLTLAHPRSFPKVPALF